MFQARFSKLLVRRKILPIKKNDIYDSVVFLLHSQFFGGLGFASGVQMRPKIKTEIFLRPLEALDIANQKPSLMECHSYLQFTLCLRSMYFARNTHRHMHLIILHRYSSKCHSALYCHKQSLCSSLIIA